MRKRISLIKQIRYQSLIRGLSLGLCLGLSFGVSCLTACAQKPVVIDPATTSGSVNAEVQVAIEWIKNRGSRKFDVEVSLHNLGSSTEKVPLQDFRCGRGSKTQVTYGAVSFAAAAMPSDHPITIAANDTTVVVLRCSLIEKVAGGYQLILSRSNTALTLYQAQ